MGLDQAIAILGWSCRVPGANSVAAYFDLLRERRCVVTRIPENRFSSDRFGHPRRGERGRSYTWAAGVLDDIWGFDPAFFGISPRESRQMDPQQRILLQLTWEALEDAGIRPSTIAGTEVGVYVGGTVSEYACSMVGDPSIAESHFATGNAYAILANRVSYIFDLRGPSMTLDTACSSSLVAVHQAVEALRTGRVETAIVGGINILAAPMPFISFSQAAMLSPTGRCRAFSADADGYVRAEGGAVLVLRMAAAARAARDPIQGIIVATGINSDGRTNGISLPSQRAQQALLRSVYRQNQIDPQRLAFVETHGTGTPAGDPVEAEALGRALGRQRSAPLPIGSVKTNIGHLEAASGLAGLIKSVLALRHGVLPASLHFAAPNPNIDFKGLNLAFCHEDLPLGDTSTAVAGVNSFGFGGTNAHVVVAAEAATVAPDSAAAPADTFLMLSAQSAPALAALAANYRDHLAGRTDGEGASIARAAAHRRDRLAHRLIVASSRPATVTAAIDAFLDGHSHDCLVVDTARGPDLPVAFVYSGNGSQWPGMGRTAYLRNTAFRARFDEIDRIFEPLAGWSLRTQIFAADIERRLPEADIAQPLIFAIQCALTAALRVRGIEPIVVLGHSVGEVAATEAAGIHSLEDAVRIVRLRSKHQGMVRGAGRMAAVLADAETVERLVSDFPGLQVAAYNAPRSATVSGSTEMLRRFIAAARRASIACLDLDLDYPFHNALMDPLKEPLLRDLRDLAPTNGRIPFISTVFGTHLPGHQVGAEYWWRNVRDPVRFQDAVRAAAEHGARFFLEIGPRGVLIKHVNDSLAAGPSPIACVSALDRGDGPEHDPIERAAAKAIAMGAAFDLERLVGPGPDGIVPLPSYPWQQTPFRYAATPEAAVSFTDVPHPLAGARSNKDALDWRGFLDTERLPALADHVVGETPIFPGTGFLEIALAVATRVLETDDVVIADFEILVPIDLANGESVEVLTRVSLRARTLEILSRPRLSEAGWTLHARGKFHRAWSRPPGDEEPRRRTGGRSVSPADLYALAARCGLRYGDAFALVRRAVLYEDDSIEVELAGSPPAGDFLLDPVRVDAGAHGLILLFERWRADERGVAYLPARIDEAMLLQSRGVPAWARMTIKSQDERSIRADIAVFGEGDVLLATLRGVRCQATPVRRAHALDSVALVETLALGDASVCGAFGLSVSPRGLAKSAERLADSDLAATSRDGARLLEGWATVASYELAAAFADEQWIDPGRLVAAGRLQADRLPWLLQILSNLGQAGLAKSDSGRFVLLNDESLPRSDVLVAELAQFHPELAPQIFVAAEVGAIAGSLATGSAAPGDVMRRVSPLAFDFHAAAVSLSRSAAARLKQLLDHDAVWPSNRAVRVLQIGAGPLTQELLESNSSRVVLTVLETDGRRLERARLLTAARENLTWDSLLEPGGQYDLIVAADHLHLLPAAITPTRLLEALAPGGLLIAVEPARSAFRDLISGLAPVDTELDQPYAYWSDAAWRAALDAAGFVGACSAPVSCAGFAGNVIIAAAPRSATGRLDRRHGAIAARIVGPSGGTGRQLAEALRRLLTETQPDERAPVESRRFQANGDDLFKSGPATRLNGHASLGKDDAVLANGRAPVGKGPAPAVVVHVVDSDPASTSLASLTKACLDIRTTVDSLGSAATTVWFVFRGAQARDGRVDPVQTGAWAFSRTVANETAQHAFRRIDVAPDVPVQVAAERIASIMAGNSNETELRIEAEAVQLVRVDGFEQVRASQVRRRPSAMRLAYRREADRQLVWRPCDRKHPGPGELEIEVVATGLNFRDVMLALGLLPDDLLEDGFTGPTLGLECAGIVAAVGPPGPDGRECGFAVGDRIIALAANAFASHVTLSADHVARIPINLSFAAAATIPVAFVTAYYSLVELAKLAAGERVLIHGAAGAVGLAAVQIARLRGAEVVATAGTEAKRELLRALGVRHVFDSRSTGFADEVRDCCGGVDVVLNSLFDDAMERSIACLKPFGRFVELGKRDYAVGTHVSLRPFRRNLSYFGVDIDQLMVHRPALGRQVLAAVVHNFETGELTPLPFSVFPSTAASRAFQVLQQSGHIGKVLVTPPKGESAPAAGAEFWIDPACTHLVTGGLGGFGLATAEWLADRGARHLVLTGRRGAARDEARDVIARLERRGVQVFAAACDVSDPDRMAELFETIKQTMPPLAGVIHSAMVLDDAILANLDAPRFERVLAPKVTGADNLDRLTRGLNLDYFVLFSSVVTMIGNRGQGSYVAANAYLEGLARRRRAAGLPALAVAWGPILDVGVVARTERMRTDLRKIGGVQGLVAREALDLMAQVVRDSGRDPRLAVVTLAPHEGTFSADLLPILASPTYRALVTRSSAGADSSQIDLRGLIDQSCRECAREAVVATVVRQLARVLLFRDEDIGVSRPLAELGLDSLMAVELALKLEQVFGVQLSLRGSGGDLTALDVANEILARVESERDVGDEASEPGYPQQPIQTPRLEIAASGNEAKHTSAGSVL